MAIYSYLLAFLLCFYYICHMINRQMKEWLDKIELPVGERVLTAGLLASFLASPLGARKEYSKQHFNNMLREYASELGYTIKEANSTVGKYMVFSKDGEDEAKPLRKISVERLIHDTNDLFFEWSACVPGGERIRPKKLKVKFVDEKLGGYLYYKDNKGRSCFMTPQLFGKWLERLNHFRNGRAPIEGRDGQGKWLILI
jgi:hypothetical protein